MVHLSILQKPQPPIPPKYSKKTNRLSLAKLSPRLRYAFREPSHRRHAGNPATRDVISERIVTTRPPMARLAKARFTVVAGDDVDGIASIAFAFTRRSIAAAGPVSHQLISRCPARKKGIPRNGGERSQQAPYYPRDSLAQRRHTTLITNFHYESRSARRMAGGFRGQNRNGSGTAREGRVRC